jgi:hypothetical protein
LYNGDAKGDLEKGEIEDPAVTGATPKEEDDTDEKKSIREISRGNPNDDEVVKDDAASELTHTGDTPEADKIEE